MKKIIIVVLLSIPVLGISQQMGISGKKLENESRRNSATERMVARDHKYRWENSYETGYAEVFIRIPEIGRFTVRLGDQEITSNTGMFRFFDVETVAQNLRISYGRSLLFSVAIHPQDNIRLVLDYFSQEGLFLLEEVNLINESDVYYGQKWNSVWNRYYPKQTGMSPTQFQDFYKAFEREAFDRDKLKFYQAHAVNTAFTTAQIASLLKTMSFDDNKLLLAKEAYQNVINPEDYYQIEESFTFSSGAEKLREFVKTFQPNRNNIRYTPVQKSQFQDFYNTFKEKNFDDDKLNFIEAHGTGIRFTTEEIALLAKEINFSNRRLSLVKKLYGNVIDPENYYQLEKVFDFDSDVRELREFLRKSRR